MDGMNLKKGDRSSRFDWSSHRFFFGDNTSIGEYNYVQSIEYIVINIIIRAIIDVHQLYNRQKNHTKL